VISSAFALPNDSELSTGLCIIGAGAAGITLALELADSGLEIMLAESGGLTPDQATNALNEGTGGGLYSLPLTESRARFFGGTTNLWAGWCRELDPTDFERRDWVAESGWPFGHEVLAPHYERARGICEVDDASIARRMPPTAADPVALGERLETVNFRLSPPTAFGNRYRDELEGARSISVLLNATASRIVRSENGSRVTSVRFRTTRGGTFSIRASAFVLATGGIENARLLLASSDDPAHSPGNEHDLVGRFYMDHPVLFSGAIAPSRACPPLTLYTTRHVRNPGADGPLTAAFAPTAGTLRAEGLLNAVIRFVPQPSYVFTGEWESNAVASARRLMKYTRQSRAPRDTGTHFRRILQGFPDLAMTLARMFRHAARTESKLLLRCFVEPEPRRESRVTLSRRMNTLGERLPHAEWLTGESEKRSVIRLHDVLAEEFRARGWGRITPVLESPDDDWPPSQAGASHHMGTTRMHSSPRKGVVDENCRVHGTANLFVAGSSVFPTCGYANPTLTIVALAVRLAAHLGSHE
jgi:choline dehydrogenase-like flavoprotein